MTALTKLLDKAYTLQDGEYLPERHISNLKTLEHEFSNFDKELVDCLYRIAVHLGEYAKRYADQILNKETTMKAAVAELRITFHHFSRNTLYAAIEKSLPIDFDDYEDLKNWLDN